MHRHGYQGRKFGRERDQRKSLIKSLADSLILHESIETTLEKAKEVNPYVEKLITKAKKGGLANRRYIIAHLQTKEASHKLVDGIAPQLSSRNSGHLRIVKTSLRRGDNAQLARISFVDELKEVSKEETVPKKSEKPKATTKAKTTPAKKAPVKKPVKAEKK
jgi:large subunit ribosomal protein L17